MNKYGLTIFSFLCLCSIINAMEPKPNKSGQRLASYHPSCPDNILEDIDPYEEVASMSSPNYIPLEGSEPARRDRNPGSIITSQSSSSSNKPRHNTVPVETGVPSSTTKNKSRYPAAISYLPNELKRFIVIPSELNENTVNEIFDQAPPEIKNIVERLQQNLDDYEEMPRGLVLYGDHGSGKTTMGQVISRKIGWNLALLNAANLATQYQNSASDNFSQILEALSDSDERFVIVVDELTGFIRDTDNQINSKNDGSSEAIWQTLDKVMLNPRLFFVGTTNDTKKLPLGIRDRSFCQLVLEIKRPDLSSRIAIISTLLPQGTDDNLKRYLAQKTDGESIRTIKKIIFNARGYAFSEHRELSQQDIDRAWTVWEKPFKESPKDKLIDASKFLFKDVLPIGIQLSGLGWSIYTALRQFRTTEEHSAQQLLFQVAGMLAQQKGLEMQQESLKAQQEALRMQEDAMLWQHDSVHAEYKINKDRREAYRKISIAARSHEPVAAKNSCSIL